MQGQSCQKLTHGCRRCRNTWEIWTQDTNSCSNSSQEQSLIAAQQEVSAIFIFFFFFFFLTLHRPRKNYPKNITVKDLLFLWSNFFCSINTVCKFCFCLWKIRLGSQFKCGVNLSSPSLSAQCMLGYAPVPVLCRSWQDLLVSFSHTSCLYDVYEQKPWINWILYLIVPAQQIYPSVKACVPH